MTSDFYVTCQCLSNGSNSMPEPKTYHLEPGLPDGLFANQKFKSG
jgi:hypothetical protein